MLCVLAAGSIARLRGDRMSICSKLQWIEFDGSKGCVNSWEFSIGVQHMEACQWLRDGVLILVLVLTRVLFFST